MSLTKEVITRARELGFTKSQLAEKIGIAVSTVDAWDKGEKAVYPGIIPALSKVLNYNFSADNTEENTGNVVSAMPEPVAVPETPAETTENMNEVSPAEENIPEAVPANSLEAAPASTPEVPAQPVAEAAPAAETVEAPKAAPAPKAKPAKKKAPAQAEGFTGISDQLAEKMKNTRFNVRDVKKNDLNASVKWLSDFGKNLEEEMKNGIEVMNGAIRELYRKGLAAASQPAQPALSKQALDFAAKFDKLSETGKAAVLAVLTAVK